MGGIKLYGGIGSEKNNRKFVIVFDKSHNNIKDNNLCFFVMK